MQAEVTNSVQTATVRARPPAAKWLIWLLPFGYLWFHLIDNLRLQWETDPQYSYGLVVPILAAGLLFRRWHRFSNVPLAVRVPGTPGYLIAGLLFLAFLYLPARLIEEATPEWRPIGWLLGIQAVGLTFYAMYLRLGIDGLKRFAFPIAFFLVAVPLPSLFEHPVIQGLGRVNAAMVADVMGILGIPAIAHGNVIEISNGVVGINDACSGIRSIQASLMVSLFLGEFYFMNWFRRLLLIPAGFVLAMFFNLCRTSLLTFIAARDGIPAISKYHDEAGITILLACTAALWAFSFLLSLRGQQRLPVAGPVSATPPAAGARPGTLRTVAAVLAIWIVVVEAGVALWYSIREAQIPPGPKWTLSLPEHDPTFKDLPFTTEEHELLRFDDGKQGQWQEPDGTLWQVFYFDWLPGRVAGYLAKRHTPDICLTATGLKMTAGPTLMVMDVNHLELPIRSYVFSSAEGPLQVFQCHWEPGGDREAYAHESSRFNLLRGIWAGRGNKGQKVFEVVITGYNDPAAARDALERKLKELIKVKGSGN